MALSAAYSRRSRMLALLVSAQNDLQNWLEMMDGDWRITIFQTNNHGEHPTHEVEAMKSDPEVKAMESDPEVEAMKSDYKGTGCDPK